MNEYKEVDNEIENLVQNSLVQIFNDRVSYDFVRPWKIRNRYTSTGTGFCVEINGNKYILTNAHCIASTTLLRVQPYGKATKYPTTIAYVMPAVDLALLTTDDDSLWKILEPMTFTNELPQLLETIYVVGYPLGGTNISFTKGVVSRLIDVIYENHGYVNNLAIQIDACINPGNSGGCSVNSDGAVVGIAFQAPVDAEGMGQIIPSCIYTGVFLHYFSKYGSLPEPERSIKTNQISELGIEYQTMENQDLRRYYKMSNEQTGILVTNIMTLSNLKDVILPGDIIMSFNGTKIESNGTVQLASNKKIHLSYDYLVTNHPPETPCLLKILREGKTQSIEVIPKYTVKAVEGNCYHTENPYLIIGGFVFINPSIQYINQLIDEEDSISPYIETIMYNLDADRPDREIIILSVILPNEINMGYSVQSFRSHQLYKFNDQCIYNLKQLASLVDNNTQSYMKLEFNNFLDNSRPVIIMDNNKVKKKTNAILKENLIAYDRSENLRN